MMLSSLESAREQKMSETQLLQVRKSELDPMQS